MQRRIGILLALLFVCTACKRQADVLVFSAKDDCTVPEDRSIDCKEYGLQGENCHNREHVLAAVRTNSEAIACVPRSLRSDAQIALLALGGDGRDLSFVFEHLHLIDRNLFNIRTFVKEAVRKLGNLIQFASEELKNDYEIVSLAIRNDQDEADGQGDCVDGAFQHASPELRANREIVKLAVLRHDACVLQYAAKELQDDRELLLLSDSVAQAPKALLDDVSFMTEAVQKLGNNLELASNKIRDNAAVVKLAVRQCGESLEFASKRLRGNHEIVKEAVEASPLALCHASAKLKGDRSLVETAASHDGRALECASHELRGDRLIVESAVQTYPHALQHASSELRGDRSIVLTAFSSAEEGDTDAFSYIAAHLKDDVEFMIAVVRKAPMFLCEAPLKIKDNWKIASVAAKTDLKVARRCVSERLRAMIK